MEACLPPADGVLSVIATDVFVALLLVVIVWGGSTGRLKANLIAGTDPASGAPQPLTTDATYALIAE
jgi:hypothetical protein